MVTETGVLVTFCGYNTVTNPFERRREIVPVYSAQAGVAFLTHLVPSTFQPSTGTVLYEGIVPDVLLSLYWGLLSLVIFLYVKHIRFMDVDFIAGGDITVVQSNIYVIIPKEEFCT